MKEKSQISKIWLKKAKLPTLLEIRAVMIIITRGNEKLGHAPFYNIPVPPNKPHINLNKSVMFSTHESSSRCFRVPSQ